MAAESTKIIIAKENSVLGKGMALFSDSGDKLGTLTWAENPKPLNPRLVLRNDGEKTFTYLDCQGLQYRIDFENLHDERGHRSGTRFLLRPLDSAEIIAEARCEIPKKSIKRTQVFLEHPIQGQFVARWKWFRGHWDLVAPLNQHVLGHIHEPSCLTFKRELQASLPNMGRAAQAFCIYVFCFCNYMGSSSVPK